MLKWIKERAPLLIIVGCIFIPIALVSVLSRWIELHYSEHEGAIAAILALLNLYWFLGSLFYMRSERFYLFVHRLLLSFRRTHTHWKIFAHFSGVKTVEQRHNRIDEISKLLHASFVKVFPGSRITINLNRNEIGVIVADGDRFYLRLDHENCEATFSTSRMLVPSHLYRSYLRNLIHLLVECQGVLGTQNSEYRLEIQFGTNPYFGFFLRNVPSNLVNAFHCVFHATIDPTCQIEVSKSAVAVSTTNCFELEDVVISYLSLSPKLLQART